MLEDRVKRLMLFYLMRTKDVNQLGCLTQERVTTSVVTVICSLCLRKWTRQLQLLSETAPPSMRILKGTVERVFSTDFGRYPVKLQNVLYMPTSRVNLISVCKTRAYGYKTIFNGNNCEMRRVENGTLALKLKHSGYSYKAIETVKIASSGEAHVVTRKDTDGEAILWHRRLGHIGDDAF